MPGPLRKPTAIQILKNDPGKRAKRRLKKEPKPEIKNIRCPRWLCEDATKLFNKMKNDLMKCGLLTVADVDAFAIYCNVLNDYLKYDKYLKELDESDLLKKTNSGYQQQHPYVGMRNKSFEQLLKLQDRFGLSPAARARIQINDNGVKSPKSNNRLEKFGNKRFG